jgi:hypothetical protein
VPFGASRRHQATHPPTKGHAAQLGGVLIVAPDGSVPYAHLADDAGDNPPNDEVLTAARRAASAASRATR